MLNIVKYVYMYIDISYILYKIISLTLLYNYIIDKIIQ